MPEDLMFAPVNFPVQQTGTTSIDGFDFANIMLQMRFISENKVSVLYVTPLRAASIRSISKICRKNKVISFTGVPEYVKNGLSVGIASNR